MSTKRRTSSWECERIRNISGTAGLERIPSVLREETRSLGHPLMWMGLKSVMERHDCLC
ncbi:unnamed protein product [Brassica napus]|uniref:(rape) hypothetical protein n=1 Tax=Brassica napus TaxID=3708 RepID=A0A816JQY5_BRANA|nr:unnamed protein product [Brassica napus]